MKVQSVVIDMEEVIVLSPSESKENVKRGKKSSTAKRLNIPVREEYFSKRYTDRAMKTFLLYLDKRHIACQLCTRA